jgi:hypothetical protein
MAFPWARILLTSSFAHSLLTYLGETSYVAAHYLTCIVNLTLSSRQACLSSGQLIRRRQTELSSLNLHTLESIDYTHFTACRIFQT